MSIEKIMIEQAGKDRLKAWSLNNSKKMGGFNSKFIRYHHYNNIKILQVQTYMKHPEKNS